MLRMGVPSRVTSKKADPGSNPALLRDGMGPPASPDNLTGPSSYNMLQTSEILCRSQCWVIEGWQRCMILSSMSMIHICGFQQVKYPHHGDGIWWKLLCQLPNKYAPYLVGFNLDHSLELDHCLLRSSKFLRAWWMHSMWSINWTNFIPL